MHMHAHARRAQIKIEPKLSRTVAMAGAASSSDAHGGDTFEVYAPPIVITDGGWLTPEQVIAIKKSTTVKCSTRPIRKGHCKNGEPEDAVELTMHGDVNRIQEARREALRLCAETKAAKDAVTEEEKAAEAQKREDRRQLIKTAKQLKTEANIAAHRARQQEEHEQALKRRVKKVEAMAKARATASAWYDWSAGKGKGNQAQWSQPAQWPQSTGWGQCWAVPQEQCWAVPQQVAPQAATVPQQAAPQAYPVPQQAAPAAWSQPPEEQCWAVPRQVAPQAGKEIAINH